MTHVSLVAVRATDACTEKRTGRRRDQRAPDGTTPQFLSSLFTRVRASKFSEAHICRTVHRAPVLRRIRPLRTLKAHYSNHYLHRAPAYTHALGPICGGP